MSTGAIPKPEKMARQVLVTYVTYSGVRSEGGDSAADVRLGPFGRTLEWRAVPDLVLTHVTGWHLAAESWRSDQSGTFEGYNTAGLPVCFLGETARDNLQNGLTCQIDFP